MWQSGAKIVIPYRLSRKDGLFNDWLSNTYYATMNRFSNISFPPGGADSFLADREIIQLLNHRISPKLTSPIAEVLRMGFDPVFVGYDRPASKNPSRWTFTKKLRLFADNFFGASSVPLRFITLMGFCVFIISLLLILLIVGAKTFSDNTVFGFPVRGWATLMIFITMFNGLILLSIGIVAEYIWRIFEEVKNRPAYIIRKEDEL
jgi:dolichol-phosphate mannosyltransferase